MTEDKQLYCTFRSEDHFFGVPIEEVKEVTTHTSCTRIPHAPEEVVGYVNLRGHIFLVLELRRLLGLHAKTIAENCLIVFKPSVGVAFGVLVGEIGDIISVDSDQLEEFRAGESAGLLRDSLKRVDIITKVCRLPTELLVILDPRQFLRVVEQLMSTVG